MFRCLNPKTEVKKTKIVLISKGLDPLFYKCLQLSIFVIDLRKIDEACFFYLTSFVKIWKKWRRQKMSFSWQYLFKHSKCLSIKKNSCKANYTFLNYISSYVRKLSMLYFLIQNVVTKSSYIHFFLLLNSCPQP